MSSRVDTQPAVPADSEDAVAVRVAAQRAAAAAPGVRAAGGPAVDAALRTAADLLRDRTDELLAANAADVATAEGNGMAAGLLDRLRLSPERLADMATQLDVLADTPEPPRQRAVRTLPSGERVFERRVPVGVIGAVFEARPNVTVDVASQVLKARSAAVLRTGSAALGSARALVELVLAPALEKNGVPAGGGAAGPHPRARRRGRAGRAARPGAAGGGAGQRRGHPPAVRAGRGGRHPGAGPRRRRRRALPGRQRGRGRRRSGWSPTAPTGSACATG